MNAARDTFAFISIVLFGAAIHVYFRPRDDATSVAVPLILAACGIVAAFIAVNADRLLKRSSKSKEGVDPEDVSVPRSGSKGDGSDIDCDD